MSRDSVVPRQPQTLVLKRADGKTISLEQGASIKTGFRQVDVCFVFDTTYSMNDKIDGLVRCMSDLVAELGHLDLDWRVTVVPFGDLTVPGDRIDSNLPFVDTVEDAVQMLRAMPRFSGGSNLGESSENAMLRASEKSYRDNAVKVLVPITDEPALGQPQELAAVHNALNALDAVCFTVSPALSYYQEWATRHGGEWCEVGQAVDTEAILAMFRSLVKRIAVVAEAVHRIGGGSVRGYLEAGGSD